jgi:hypothetical protein
VEALPDLSRLGHVETEGCEAGRTGPGGADFQKVAARDLWHRIPPRERFCRRLKASVLTVERCVNKVVNLPPLAGPVGRASGARGVAPREWRFSAIRAIETSVPSERLRRSGRAGGGVIRLATR